MSENQQVTTTEAPHYEDVEAKNDGPAQRYEKFVGEIKEREHEIATMLPSNLNPEKFRNTAIAAVKQNPALIQCTRRSLIQAITRAAQDGLLPDGREGIITPFKGSAVWNPMAAGLRKRLRELDGIIADAQVVYENDVFVWHQGDDPRIEHEPAKLGTPRGTMLGAYCVFKREDKTILHREVMDRLQIEAVKKQSKAQDSLMWTVFETEGWRKTVLRRGVKTVPTSDTMAAIIKRDDEANFDFAETVPTVAVLTPPPAPPPTPQVEHKPGEVLSQADKAVLGAAMKPEAEKAPRRKKGENRGPAKAAEAPQLEPQGPQGPQANGPDPNDPRFKTADEWKAEADAAAPAGDSENPRVEGLETAGILSEEWTDYLELMEGELALAKTAQDTAAVHSTVEDSIQGALERGKIDTAMHEKLVDEWSRRTS